MVSMLSVGDERLHFGPLAGNCIPLLLALVRPGLWGLPWIFPEQ